MQLSARRWGLLSRRKVAISEIMGTLIMIAITLIAGVAVFGFVNGQSGSSAQAVGNSAASNINFLNEKLAIVQVQLSNLSSGGGTIWGYNYGSVGYTLASIQIQNVTDQLASGATCFACSAVSVVFYPTVTTCPSGQTCGPSGSDQSGYSGAAPGCTSGTLGSSGFLPSPNSAVGMNKLTPAPYTFSFLGLPGICGTITSGTTYRVTMTGEFGSTAPIMVVAT